jgi:virulence factor Mce-like protein
MFGRSRTRRTVRRRGPRPATVLFSGLLTIALIGGFIWLAENSYNGLPFLNYRTVYASVPNIGHLEQHDPVDIDGVHVGQVLQTTTKSNHALVKLQLQGVGPLPKNSQVIVRADGLLGQRYVELVPGTSHTMLPNGGKITETNPSTTYYNGIPETLDIFNAKTRTALGQMIRGLGTAVEGRGQQLNQAIQVGPQSGADFDSAAYAILARPGAAAAFLPATDSGVTALDDNRVALTDTFRPASNALQPLISQRAQAEQGISEIPGFERGAIDYGFFARGKNLLEAAIQLTKTLDPIVPKLPSALGAGTDLLNDTPGDLRKTKTVLDQVPATVPAALGILAAAKPDLTPLKTTLVSLVKPVSSLAEHGCDIQNFATGVDSLVSFGTLPGGPFGPDVGFPIGEQISPSAAGSEINIGQQFPTESSYDPPCFFTPGATYNTQTMLQLLSGVFPGS